MEEKLVPYHAIHKIVGHRVLVFAPHPDDEVFGCGGAILRHVNAGDALQVIIVSDGEYRANEAQRVAYGVLRQAESCQAAKLLGCGTPIFWGIPDRSIEYGERLIERMMGAITTHSADLVYAPSVYEMHPDHRAVGMAALEAARRHAAQPSIALYEVGVPMPRINTLLDISDLTDRKQNAMACFVSQLQEQAYDQHISALNRFRTYTLGKQISSAEGYLLATASEVANDFLGLYISEYERQRNVGLALVPGDIPLVSILVRSMDRPFLREALDSLALQTYPNIEVVVINAQAERHQALGDFCGRFPIKIINSYKPLLRSHAANVGLDSAKGEFLLFLDDDDWLAPDHISNLVAAINSHANCYVAYAGVEFREVDRKPSEAAPFNEPFNAGRLRGGNYIPIHAVIFSRKLVVKGARFDERFNVYEDWDFLLQLSNLTGFIHVNKVSAYYRASGTSGVGAIADETAKLHARTQIFEKWKLLWTGAQIDAIVPGTIEALMRRHNTQLDGLRLELDGLRIEVLEAQRKISEKESDLAVRAREIVQWEQRYEAFKPVVRALEDQLIDRDHAISVSNAAIHDVLTSTSWAVTRPLRWFSRRMTRLKQYLHRSRAPVVMSNAASAITGSDTPNNSAIQQLPAIPRAFLTRKPNGTYELSGASKGYTYIEPQRPADLEDQLSSKKLTTSFSIVVPVYNTPTNWLEAALRSVLAQWYSNWTLILIDDASTSEETRAALRQIKDPKIQLLRLERNLGIAGATNVGLEAAKGDFVVFMDHDDELTSDCLFEMALCIARDQPDFIYSDEDKLDQTGGFTQPHFKPDWSPETMMSTMFTGHVSCARRSLLEQVGTLRTEVNGCQDWDFVLRISEHTTRISHIPKVLYHWRIIPASVASDIAAKPYVLAASQRVRADALTRRGLKGTVEPVVEVPGYFRVNYHLQGSPKISIIIPTRDGGGVLRCCIESIIKVSNYRNFEIIVLDNGSIDSSTVAYLSDLDTRENIRVVRHDKPFNFSELNNIGAHIAKGELLLFLNDDTEVIAGDWLERMGGYAQLPHVGAVGAKLIYPDSSKIQHAGVINNLAVGPAHAFHNQAAELPGYFMRNLLEYNWLAVTGACLMIEAKKFHSIGAFDVAFPIAYNDIELCIRAYKKGFFNVVCQAVTLVHHESASRGLDRVDPAKVRRLQGELLRLYDTHPDYYQFDPFHNPNLDPTGLNFEVSQ